MQTSSACLREPCERRGDPDFNIYYYVFYTDYYENNFACEAFENEKQVIRTKEEDEIGRRYKSKG